MWVSAVDDVHSLHAVCVGFAILISSILGSAQSNPLSLQSVQPNAVVAGSGTTMVTLKGNGFTSSAVVLLYSAASSAIIPALVPNFVDETTLQVAIPSTALATPATFSVQVFINSVQ